MRKFKDVPIMFTTSAYIEFSRDICELDELSNCLDGKTYSQQVETMAKIITICANAYVDCVNSKLSPTDKNASGQPMERYSVSDFLTTLSPKELNEGITTCMEEINFSMGVDTPSDIKLKERDYELEELEKQKKIGSE